MRRQIEAWTTRGALRCLTGAGRAVIRTLHASVREDEVSKAADAAGVVIMRHGVSSAVDACRWVVVA